MTDPHPGAGGHDDSEVDRDETLDAKGAGDELDTLAYETITHNGSLVPRSLLDFLR